MSYYHSNSELHRCLNKDGQLGELKEWDQRIPNKPLLERHFLIGRPPVHHIGRPVNTNLCQPVPKCWQITSPSMEQQSKHHWQNYLQGNHSIGLPINQPATHPIEQGMGECPVTNHRPWLHGVNRDVHTESHLRRLDYYNPEDYIGDAQQIKLHRLQQQAVLRLHNNNQNGIYLDNTPLWLNNPTKMINQEPLYYDHTTTCKKEHANRVKR